MTEDTARRASFAWAGKGREFTLTSIEDTVADLIGLDSQGVMDIYPSRDIGPNLDEAKERLAEEMDRRTVVPIFSYRYYSELIRVDGIKVPIENTVIVLRQGNGDNPLVVGVARACDTCPILRQIETLCRKLDDAGRRLALRLIGALTAA